MTIILISTKVPPHAHPNPNEPAWLVEARKQLARNERTLERERRLNRDWKAPLIEMPDGFRID